MEAARALIENCWIDKKKDKELYRKVRRELPNCQKFFREQLGWAVINNEQILKAEKIPAHAESYTTSIKPLSCSSSISTNSDNRNCSCSSLSSRNTKTAQKRQ